MLNDCFKGLPFLTDQAKTISIVSALIGIVPEILILFGKSNAAEIAVKNKAQIYFCQSYYEPNLKQFIDDSLLLYFQLDKSCNLLVTYTFDSKLPETLNAKINFFHFSSNENGEKTKRNNDKNQQAFSRIELMLDDNKLIFSQAEFLTNFQQETKKFIEFSNLLAKIYPKQ